MTAVADRLRSSWLPEDTDVIEEGDTVEYLGGDEEGVIVASPGLVAEVEQIYWAGRWATLTWLSEGDRYEEVFDRRKARFRVIA